MLRPSVERVRLIELNLVVEQRGKLIDSVPQFSREVQEAEDLRRLEWERTLFDGVLCDRAGKKSVKQ